VGASLLPGHAAEGQPSSSARSRFAPELSRIRVLVPDCAVVLMSAHASAEIAAAARAMGAFDILPKPFDLDGCEQTLRQARNAVRH